MSKAFRCDRCEDYFDPSEFDSTMSFITIKEYICQNGSDYAKNEVWERYEGTHLCPRCTKWFERFMDNSSPEYLPKRWENEENT